MDPISKDDMAETNALFSKGDLSSLGHDPVLAPVWHDIVNPAAKFEEIADPDAP